MLYLHLHFNPYVFYSFFKIISFPFSVFFSSSTLISHLHTNARPPVGPVCPGGRCWAATPTQGSLSLGLIQQSVLLTSRAPGSSCVWLPEDTFTQWPSSWWPLTSWSSGSYSAWWFCWLNTSKEPQTGAAGKPGLEMFTQVCQKPRENLNESKHADLGV